MHLTWVAALLLTSSWGDELKRDMTARGIAAAEQIVPFDSTPAIEAFALRAVAGAREPRARADKLYRALLELKHQGAIAGDRDNTPKERPPKTAADLMRLVGDKTAGDRKAGCYELAALYVAAARAAGLTAFGIERDEPSGTGQIGHVMAGIEVGGGEHIVFDLQNETVGTNSRVRELNDLDFAGHHYNHLAVAAFLHGALPEALRAIDLALTLAPESASFLNNRATILAGLGEPVLASAEAVHAIELAPDVPLYRYQLGRLHLISGELAPALVAFDEALLLKPRYGVARRDRGWALLLSGRPRDAETELGQALKDDAQTPDGELYLGLFYLAEKRRDDAKRVVDQALAKQPRDRNLSALQRLVQGKDGKGDREVQRLREVLQSVHR